MKKILSIVGKLLPLIRFRGSSKYWEDRYRLGGESGDGSRGVNAEYKASVINRFIAQHGISSMIEFGCGDGVQLEMFDAPIYIGVDVSQTVIQHCRTRFSEDSGKSFILSDDYLGEHADLSLSLDVIFHLVEDAVYHTYLDQLFAAAKRYVLIYSTSADLEDTGVPHVRHRDVAADVRRLFPQFERMAIEVESLPPPVRFDRGLPTRFFIYQRQGAIPSRNG
jgi:SAM-dependent methyltransferase